MSGDRKRSDVRRLGSFLSAMRQQRGGTDREDRAGAAPEAPHQSPFRPTDQAGAPASGRETPPSERLIDASIRHVAAASESASGDAASGDVAADDAASSDSDDPGAAAQDRASSASAPRPPAGLASSDETALRGAVQEIWNAASLRYSLGVGRTAAQFGPRILELTGTRPGESMLDIACGPGALAGAADAFGISATGIDFAPAMITAARARFPRVEFRIGDAEALDVFASSFEAVVSTFGVTQFINPERSLREAFRALKPSGRLILAHWSGAEGNPLLAAADAALEGHAAGVQRRIDFSDPQRSEQALQQAGFETIATERAEAVLSLDEPELLEAAQMLDPAIALRIASMSAAQKAALGDAIAKALAPYRTGATFDVPAQAIFYIAARPAAEAAETSTDSRAEPAPQHAPVVADAPAAAQPAAPVQPVDRLWQSAARRSGLGERQQSVADPLARQRPPSDAASHKAQGDPSDTDRPRQGFSDAASWKARSRTRFLSRSQNQPDNHQPDRHRLTERDALPGEAGQQPDGRGSAPEDHRSVAPKPNTEQTNTAQTNTAQTSATRRKPAFGLVRRMLDRSDRRD